MDGKSLNPIEEKLRQLRDAFPEAISEGKIDVERLKQTLGEEVFVSGERYHLSWAGKSDAFKAIQTPTTATLKPQKKESVDFDSTQNIFIEGENLEVLKVLQRSYYSKIKMIYIDPPYNTGNDSFIYPDKFSESKEEYLKRIGDKDEAGYLTKEGLFRKNSKENGQFHSNWLSMMYPRLFLARNLLRDDGVIFVSIDDNEVHNLRLIMNEIFGEENFVAEMVWEQGKKNIAQFIAVNHEYMIVFAKNFNILRESGFKWRQRKQGLEKIYSEFDRLTRKHKNNFEKISEGLREFYKKLDPGDPARKQQHYYFVDQKGIYFADNIAQGTGTGGRYDVLHPKTKKPCVVPSGGWRLTEENMRKLLESDEIHFGEDESKVPCRKRYLKETEYELPPSVFYRDGRAATILLNRIMGGDFLEFPKDLTEMKRLISIATNSGDIILDFFAGSGTTGHAVMELEVEQEASRKFILVQLNEKTDTESESYKGGYKTIADICRERVRRVSREIKEEARKKTDLFPGKMIDVGFRSFTLESSSFKVWRTDVIENVDDLRNQVEAFQDPVKKKSEAEAMAWEILLRSGYELTTPLEHREIASVSVYSIANGEVMLALEKISQKAIDGMIEMKPKKVICLDSLFAGNDQLKKNTALQMKDAGVEFKTI